MNPIQIVKALIGLVNASVFPNLNRSGAKQVTDVLSLAERFIAEAEEIPAPDSEEIEQEADTNE